MRRRKGLIFQHGKVAAAGCYDEGGKGKQITDWDREEESERKKKKLFVGPSEKYFTNSNLRKPLNLDFYRNYIVFWKSKIR